METLEAEFEGDGVSEELGDEALGELIGEEEVPEEVPEEAEGKEFEENTWGRRWWQWGKELLGQ